jgi:hypothetical protein
MKQSVGELKVAVESGPRDATLPEHSAEVRSWLRRFERCYLGIATKREYEEMGFTDDQRLERYRARNSFRRGLEKCQAGDERQIPMTDDVAVEGCPMDALLERIDLLRLTEVATDEDEPQVHHGDEQEAA